MLTLREFTIDTTAPVISQTSQIPFVSVDSTPSFTLTSSEAGTIVYGGACSSTETAAVVGNNIITLNQLPNGYYSNCTIEVRDAAGFLSNKITIPNFIIDATAPVISLITPVTTPGTDSTPNIVISSSRAGTVVYG